MPPLNSPNSIPLSDDSEKWKAHEEEGEITHKTNVELCSQATSYEMPSAESNRNERRKLSDRIGRECLSVCCMLAIALKSR
jgi:hypothetical protein